MGPPDVWIIQCNQYNRLAQHVDCHDVEFLPNHFRQIRCGVEIRKISAMDELFRGWWNSAATIQHVPKYENGESIIGKKQKETNQEFYSKFVLCQF